MNEQSSAPNLLVDLLDLVESAGRVSHAYASGTQMHSTDFGALLHIARCAHLDQQISSSQLAEHLGITPSATTYLVDRLCERGQLQRVPDPADRRRQLLQLSDAGKQVHADYFAPLGARLNTALAGYSASERATFAQMLGAITQAMDEFHSTQEAQA